MKKKFRVVKNFKIVERSCSLNIYYRVRTNLRHTFSKEHSFTILIDSDFFIINVPKVKVCKLSSRECFGYFPLFFLREFPCACF